MAVITIGLPGVARAQSDTLSVNPASGPPGKTVTLTGTGFNAYSGSAIEIDISIDYGNGNWVPLVAGAANPVPDANGNFTVTATVPANAPPGDLLAISTITEPEADAFFTVTQGTAVPAAPSNLTVTAVDSHDIKLSWQDNSSNETGFEVNNGVVSRTAPAGSSSYTWGGLAPGTYMCFRIRAVNSAGDSAWEPDVSPWYRCTTTPKTMTPAAPSNLTVTAVDSHDIKLNWQDNSSNETGFEISNRAVSRTAPAGSSSYTWGGLAPGTYMCFRIRAVNSAGDSAWEPGGSPSYRCATTPKPAARGPSTNRQPDWAGWSWHPQHGTVSMVTAEWKVPQVDCGAPPRPKKAPNLSRVAVWAGLWGRDNTGNRSWLSQIGTASLCVAGFARTFAIYQMFNGSGAGTTPNTLPLRGLQAGDTVQAKVWYAGPSQGRLKFYIYIHDLNRNSTAGGFIVTAKGVSLADAAHQGGVIVEDNGDNGDLAKFGRPVTIWNVQVSGGSGWLNTRWLMVVSSTLIATTGPLQHGSFSVTWLNY